MGIVYIDLTGSFACADKQWVLKLTCMVVLMALLGPCSAASTWIGGEESSWMDPNSWDTGIVPDAFTDVIIPSGKTVEIPGTNLVDLNSLVIGGTLTVTNIHGIVIFESLSISSTGKLVWNTDSTFTVSETAQIDGSLELLQGSMDANTFTSSGSVKLCVLLDVTKELVLSGGKLSLCSTPSISAKSLTWSELDELEFENSFTSATVTTNQALASPGGSVLWNSAAGEPPSFLSVVRAFTASTQIVFPFSVSILESFSSTASASFENGLTLKSGASLTSTSAVSVKGPYVEAEWYTLEPNTVFESGGTVDCGNLVFERCVLGGVLESSGNVKLVDSILNGMVMVLSGTVDVSGAILLKKASSLALDSFSTVEIASGTVVTINSDESVVTNKGTLTTAGSVEITGNFVNEKDISVHGGQLSLSGASQKSGSISLENGGKVVFENSEITVSDGLFSGCTAKTVLDTLDLDGVKKLLAEGNAPVDVFFKSVNFVEPEENSVKFDGCGVSFSGTANFESSSKFTPSFAILEEDFLLTAPLESDYVLVQQSESSVESALVSVGKLLVLMGSVQTTKFPLKCNQCEIVFVEFAGDSLCSVDFMSVVATGFTLDFGTTKSCSMVIGTAELAGGAFNGSGTLSFGTSVSLSGDIELGDVTMEFGEAPLVLDGDCVLNGKVSAGDLVVSSESATLTFPGSFECETLDAGTTNIAISGSATFTSYVKLDTGKLTVGEQGRLTFSGESVVVDGNVESSGLMNVQCQSLKLNGKFDNTGTVRQTVGRMEIASGSNNGLIDVTEVIFGAFSLGENSNIRGGSAVFRASEQSVICGTLGTNTNLYSFTGSICTSGVRMTGELTTWTQQCLKDVQEARVVHAVGTITVSSSLCQNKNIHFVVAETGKLSVTSPEYTCTGCMVENMGTLEIVGAEMIIDNITNFKTTDMSNSKITGTLVNNNEVLVKGDISITKLENNLGIKCSEDSAISGNIVMQGNTWIDSGTKVVELSSAVVDIIGDGVLIKGAKATLRDSVIRTAKSFDFDSQMLVLDGVNNSIESSVAVELGVKSVEVNSDFETTAVVSFLVENGLVLSSDVEHFVIGKLVFEDKSVSTIKNYVIESENTGIIVFNKGTVEIGGTNPVHSFENNGTVKFSGTQDIVLHDFVSNSELEVLEDSVVVLSHNVVLNKPITGDGCVQLAVYPSGEQPTLDCRTTYLKDADDNIQTEGTDATIQINSEIVTNRGRASFVYGNMDIRGTLEMNGTIRSEDGKNMSVASAVLGNSFIQIDDGYLMVKDKLTVKNTTFIMEGAIVDKDCKATLEKFDSVLCENFVVDGTVVVSGTISFGPVKNNGEFYVASGSVKCGAEFVNNGTLSVVDSTLSIDKYSGEGSVVLQSTTMELHDVKDVLVVAKKNSTVAARSDGTVTVDVGGSDAEAADFMTFELLDNTTGVALNLKLFGESGDKAALDALNSTRKVEHVKINLQVNMNLTEGQEYLLVYKYGIVQIDKLEVVADTLSPDEFEVIHRNESISIRVGDAVVVGGDVEKVPGEEVIYPIPLAPIIFGIGAIIFLLWKMKKHGKILLYKIIDDDKTGETREMNKSSGNGEDDSERYFVTESTISTSDSDDSENVNERSLILDDKTPTLISESISLHLISELSDDEDIPVIPPLCAAAAAPLPVPRPKPEYVPPPLPDISELKKEEAQPPPPQATAAAAIPAAGHPALPVVPDVSSDEFVLQAQMKRAQFLNSQLEDKLNKLDQILDNAEQSRLEKNKEENLKNKSLIYGSRVKEIQITGLNPRFIPIDEEGDFCFDA